jgi:hypothetical protein
MSDTRRVYSVFQYNKKRIALMGRDKTVNARRIDLKRMQDLMKALAGLDGEEGSATGRGLGQVLQRAVASR